MYNFMKKGAMMLLIAGLAMSVTNCSDDDPNYDNVTPPEVAIAPNTLTGVITSINGSAIPMRPLRWERKRLQVTQTACICLQM